MSDEQRDNDESRTPAADLLQRIGRLARQARKVAEGLTERLLERAAPRRRTASEPAAAAPLASEPEPEPGAMPGHGARLDDCPPTGPAVVPEPEVAPEPTTLDSVDEGLPALSTGADEARVVLLSRDPHWLFCYWDFPGPRAEVPDPPQDRLALRLHDVTDLEFDGGNSWSQHLYPMTEGARWWHVPIPRPDRYYLAEVGRLAPSGAFVVLGRSEATTTPAPGPSAQVGEEMATLPPDALGQPDPAEADPGAPIGGPVAETDRERAREWPAPDALPTPPTSAAPWSVPR